MYVSSCYFKFINFGVLSQRDLVMAWLDDIGIGWFTWYQVGSPGGGP